MKKIYLLMGVMALSLFVVACGNDKNPVANNGEQNVGNETSKDEATNDTNQEEANQTPANVHEDMKSQMEKLDYTEFTLEVDYPSNQEYNAELELEDNGQMVDAEIEDSIKGLHIKGEEAFNAIYPIVEKLTIDQSTSKENAIQEVLKEFNLSADYVEIEIDLKFKDGTKLEFKDRK